MGSIHFTSHSRHAWASVDEDTSLSRVDAMDRACKVGAWPLCLCWSWTQSMQGLSQQTLQLCLPPVAPDGHGLVQGPWGQGREHLDSVTRPSWESGGGDVKPTKQWT